MRRLYCQMTCSPDQALFMDVNVVFEDFITKISYYVSPEAKQGIYDSCKDVTFPGNNEKVLNLLCGTSVEMCTPQKLLSYMGSTANGFAPFDILYPQKLTVSGVQWMNESVFSCSESFIDPQTNKTASTCSCEDCTASCPVHPSPSPTPKHIKIGGLNVLAFSLIMVYIVFLVVFIPLSVFCSIRSRSQTKCTPSANRPEANLKYSAVSTYPPVSKSLPELIDSPPGLCEQLGSKLESTLRHWFAKWGVWCSTHPFVVILGCLLFVLALSCGLLFFQVTTDPVELWSAANSRARKEKDTYDTKFAPFYRTEQLIIRTTNRGPTGYHPYGTPTTNWVPLGPVFYLDLLNQVCDVDRLVLCLHSALGVSYKPATAGVPPATVANCWVWGWRQPDRLPEEGM